MTTEDLNRALAWAEEGEAFLKMLFAAGEECERLRAAIERHREKHIDDAVIFDDDRDLWEYLK